MFENVMLNLLVIFFRRISGQGILINHFNVIIYGPYP